MYIVKGIHKKWGVCVVSMRTIIYIYTCLSSNTDYYGYNLYVLEGKYIILQDIIQISIIYLVYNDVPAYKLISQIIKLCL